MFYTTAKRCKTRELKIHIVFTCSVMSKIEFSWENSTYLLGKINALISGHPGGSTSGKYGGIGRDLLTFVANVWPGTRALDHFCTSEARYKGKDPRDL